jgi:hypothetical protein
MSAKESLPAAQIVARLQEKGGAPSAGIRQAFFRITWRASASEAHHIRFAQPRALGRKVSEEYTVPICRLHHRELHRYGEPPGGPG